MRKREAGKGETRLYLARDWEIKFTTIIENFTEIQKKLDTKFHKISFHKKGTKLNLRKSARSAGNKILPQKAQKKFKGTKVICHSRFPFSRFPRSYLQLKMKAFFQKLLVLGFLECKYRGWPAFAYFSFFARVFK